MVTLFLEHVLMYFLGIMFDNLSCYNSGTEFTLKKDVKYPKVFP